MSSNNESRSDRDWSLTRRLALIFALANGLVLLAYTVVLGVEVMDILRDDLRQFMEHELSELGQEVLKTDGTQAGVQSAVDHVALVSGEVDCALRVRRSDGTLLAEGGSPHLLARATEPIPLDGSWRSRLLRDRIALRAKRIPDSEFVTEIIVDGDETVERMLELLGTGIIVFLAAAAVTGVVGWVTAHRGLRSLRDVVSQASDIRTPTAARPIRLDGAPREVREVGVALNAMLDRIQETLETMRAFTAGLAHELRSPLQNLIGETEVTLLSARSSDEYRALLRSNLEDLYDLTDAVDNLVTYCRTAEPTRPDIEVERFSLADEAELRLARERRVAERKGVDVTYASSGDCTLEADRESVLRVLRNLVGNAIIWTPAERSVQVRVEGVDGAVRIVVDDEGPGVSPELGDRIFEPFVTGQTRRGKRGGYGLGLAICRAILEDHGGTLAYQRSELGGARFVATFPRRPAGAAVAPSAREPVSVRS